MAILSGQTLKGYEIHGCIGQGAFGAVHRAYQPVIDREVAIKVFSPSTPTSPISSAAPKPRRSSWCGRSISSSCRCANKNTRRAHNNRVAETQDGKNRWARGFAWETSHAAWSGLAVGHQHRNHCGLW